MAKLKERRLPASFLPKTEETPAESRAGRFFCKGQAQLRRLGVAASVVIVSVSVFIFGRTLLKIDLARVRERVPRHRRRPDLMAFGLAATSYVALTGYDALALRHLGVRVPYPLTALASFTSYAISFTLGFPLVTGGAVRFWIYGPAGLSAGKIASLTVVAGITFWLGMGLVLAAGFIVRRERDRRDQPARRRASTRRSARR